MFSSFVVMFVFNATETTTTPLSLKFFDWGEFENSIYFSSAGSLVSIGLDLYAISRTFMKKITVLHHSLNSHTALYQL